MNVGQMIKKVRLLIDNDLTDEQIVSQFNELTRKLYRKFPLPDKIYKFTTTSIPYYDLPSDCSEDRIRSVVIDDIEYVKLSPEVQVARDYFCSVIAGKLFIHPNTEGKDAYLYYRQRPVELSASNLGQVPDFPEDFHDLYVYDAARWIAQIQRDTDLVNNFQAEFDDILRDAERQLRKMGLKTVRLTTIW